MSPRRPVSAAPSQANVARRAIHESGRTVPGDISVISVDDIALAEYASPALTTVRQPFKVMRSATTLLLIAQIENDPHITKPASVAPALVVRAFTAAPRRLPTVRTARSGAPPRAQAATAW